LATQENFNLVREALDMYWMTGLQCAWDVFIGQGARDLFIGQDLNIGQIAALCTGLVYQQQLLAMRLRWSDVMYVQCC
jgi:hypothetical protein